MIGSIYSFLFAYETMSLLSNYNTGEDFPRKLNLSGFTYSISTRCGDIYIISNLTMYLILFQVMRT